MPKILTKKLQYQSKIFDIYNVELEFDNGVRVDYEVLYKDTVWSAMIVPMNEKGEVGFVKEYFVTLDDYQLCLPKGGVNYRGEEKGVAAVDAANKELQEEIGMKAKKLVSLAKLTTSPGSINKATEVFLAQDLIESKKEGDEPEELEVVWYPLANFEKLIDSGELTESRAIAALFLAERYFKSREEKNV